MLINYFKLTIKVLLRRKFFTGVSLFAISFTLMVLIVATSLLDHLFGPHEPEQFADRSVGVFEVRATKHHGENNISQSSGFGGYYLLKTLVEPMQTPEMKTFATFTSSTYSYNHGEKIKIYFKHVDPNFWKIFNIRLLEGNYLTTDDETQARPVIVINENTAKKFFGRESALGKIIEFNGIRFTVVGVAENVPFMRQVPFSDVWAPISTLPNISQNRDIVGRFTTVLVGKSKDDLPAIRQEFEEQVAKFTFPDDSFDEIKTKLETPFEFVSRVLTDQQSKDDQSGLFLTILILIAVLFMLLPTINLININVSRIYERSSEIGVRKSFGASSYQLINQFLVENIIITFFGGLIGIVLSALVLEMINQANWIPYSTLSINFRIFFTGLTMTVFLGIISGVYPAWKMSRLNPVQALKGTR